LAGPVVIAVTAAGGPRPALSTGSCADLPDALACIDTLYRDLGCDKTIVSSTFGSFTALPNYNSYQALCVSASACTALNQEIQFALDRDGNILLPMDWQGVRLQRNEVPVPRRLSAT